jgi:colanic acid/amylovoran biosynthesis protein
LSVPKKITITNMTGARNRGCEALVSSIIHGMETTFGSGEIEISISSNDSSYDAHVFRGRVKSVYPTTYFPKPHWSPAAQRAFYRASAQLPIMRGNKRFSSIANMKAADLLIATGGDVFTSDYDGLMNHARVLQVGRPVALLGHTIGPFTATAETRFRESLRNMVLCTVRESESLNYLREVFPELKVEQTADVAFILPATDRETARRILEDEHHFAVENRRLVGLSVSSGVLSYRNDVEPDFYLNEFAAFVDWLNELGFSVILLPHVQERSVTNNDVYACREVLKRVRAPQENLLLSLSVLSASDYKGVIGLCEALVGTRTHATIASMSQGIPTVSIAYSRKAWGIMRDYYGRKLGDMLTVDVARMDRERLKEAFETALANGRTDATAAKSKKLALTNFEMVRNVIQSSESAWNREPSRRFGVA